jgi:hypothetical protein
MELLQHGLHRTMHRQQTRPSSALRTQFAHVLWATLKTVNPHQPAGHLGNMNELMLAGALMGVEMSMRDAGINITPGSGVAHAVDYWQKTTPVIPSRESLMA